MALQRSALAAFAAESGAPAQTHGRLCFLQCEDQSCAGGWEDAGGCKRGIEGYIGEIHGIDNIKRFEYPTERSEDRFVAGMYGSQKEFPFARKAPGIVK